MTAEPTNERANKTGQKHTGLEDVEAMPVSKDGDADRANADIPLESPSKEQTVGALGQAAEPFSQGLLRIEEQMQLLRQSFDEKLKFDARVL